MTTYKFAQKTYSTDTIVRAPAIDLNAMTGPDILSLFNLIQSNLGHGTIKRFKDSPTAVKRTVKALEEFAAVVAAEEAAGAVSTPPNVPAADLNEANAIVVNDTGTKIVGTGEPDTFKLVLSPEDAAQVAAEATDRKTVAPKAPKEPKPPKAPRVLKRRDARKLKDGSYQFDILPRMPLTLKISEAREELLGYLASGEATWAGLLEHTGKDVFRTVTTVTMFSISLGYGVKTQPDGTLLLIEPLAAPE